MGSCPKYPPIIVPTHRIDAEDVSVLGQVDGGGIVLVALAMERVGPRP